jgi:hypothetical protein
MMEVLVEDLDPDEEAAPMVKLPSRRFDVTRVTPLDYLLFDLHAEGEPIVYWLFMVGIEHKWYNWQVLLSRFDPSGRTISYTQLDREIWSTMLYTDMEGLAGICPRIISLLEQLDLNYPVELTYTFGGQAYPPPFVFMSNKKVEAIDP